jgi:hypothetical protein
MDAFSTASEDVGQRQKRAGPEKDNQREGVSMGTLGVNPHELDQMQDNEGKGTDRFKQWSTKVRGQWAVSHRRRYDRGSRTIFDIMVTW